MLSQIFNWGKRNIFLIALVVFFSCLFFYHLGFVSLASFDEAWYGAIARNILSSGSWLKLFFNGAPYYDHPPVGFWLMAISYKVLGVSEFSTRFPSALLSVFSIVFMYLLGYAISKKKSVGYAASLILGTCVWYVIRVRSGNLDAILVFFYLLTVYLAYRSSENFKWFPLTALSFGALVMSKTLVGVSAIVLIFYLNGSQFLKVKKNALWLISGCILFMLVVVPWYQVQIYSYRGFIENHFISKGLRDKSITSFLSLDYQQPLFYVHMGVLKWYRLWQIAFVPFVLGILVNFLRFFKEKKTRSVFFRTAYLHSLLFVWSVIILYPFLTKNNGSEYNKTEIWHLIPTYIPIALVIAIGLFNILIFFSFIVRKINFLKSIRKMVDTRVLEFVFVSLITIVAFVQVRGYYKDILPASHFEPDEVDISKRLKKYDQRIFVDQAIIPIAVFYSGHNVTSMVYESTTAKTFNIFFRKYNSHAIVAVQNWMLNDLDKEKIHYRLFERNNSFSIIGK